MLTLVKRALTQFGLEPRALVKLHSPLPNMFRMVIIDWLRARIIIQQTDLDGIDYKDASLEAILENEAYDTEEAEVERIPIAWLVAFKKVRWPPALLESARLQAGPDGLGEIDDAMATNVVDYHLENFERRDTRSDKYAQKNRRQPLPIRKHRLSAKQHEQQTDQGQDRRREGHRDGVYYSFSKNLRY